MFPLLLEQFVEQSSVGDLRRSCARCDVSYNVLQAGSTMWKRAWGLLSGAFTLHDIQHAMKILNVTENNLVHDENYARLSGIRRIRHPQNLTKEKSYFKVLVVRNPYQRLLSAYMDLIKENAPHFKQISNQIANRYRGTSSGIERAATFGEFIEHVLHEYESNTVRRGIDDHWTPIHQLCHPCEIRYDYIIKLEHHDDDVYVFMKNFFNDTFTMDEVFDRNAGPHSDRNETDIKLYYTIEQKKLQKLGEFLDFDCRLFEYDNVSRSINWKHAEKTRVITMSTLL